MPPKKKSPLFPAPRPAELVFVLDRVQMTSAILVDERGLPMAVPMDRLPRNPPPGRGDVIRVPLGEERRPMWHAAKVGRREQGTGRETAGEGSATTADIRP